MQNPAKSYVVLSNFRILIQIRLCSTYKKYPPSLPYFMSHKFLTFSCTVLPAIVLFSEIQKQLHLHFHYNI